MVIVEILRIATSKEFGTFGAVKINKGAFCVSLEPPDEENHSNISSIPTGQYICKRTQSRTFGETFEIMDVTDRTNVLLHAGNVVEHTQGCIILGQYWGKTAGR